MRGRIRPLAARERALTFAEALMPLGCRIAIGALGRESVSSKPVQDIDADFALE